LSGGRVRIAQARIRKRGIGILLHVELEDADRLQGMSLLEEAASELLEAALGEIIGARPVESFAEHRVPRHGAVDAGAPVHGRQLVRQRERPGPPSMTGHALDLHVLGLRDVHLPDVLVRLLHQLHHPARDLLHGLLIGDEVEGGERLSLLAHVAEGAADAERSREADHRGLELFFGKVLGEHLEVLRPIGPLESLRLSRPGKDGREREEDEDGPGDSNTKAQGHRGSFPARGGRIIPQPRDAASCSA